MDRFGELVNENELMLLRMYETTRKELLSNMIEAAVKGNDVKYLRFLRKNIDNEIAKLNKKFQFYSTEQQKYNYTQGIKEQEKAFEQLKITFDPVVTTSLNSFGGLHKEAIKTLAINTYKSLDRVREVVGRDCIEFIERTNFKSTQAILKSLSDFYPGNEKLREIGLKVTKGTVAGNRTWQQSMRDFEKDFAKNGIFKVPYLKKSGDLHALVDIHDYAKLVARTTSAEAYRQGSQNSILETFDNNDLVQIIGTSKIPTSPCIPYQGNILSLTGKTEGYITIDTAKAAGLFHPNCVHHFAVTMDVIKEYERKNIDY